MWIESLNCDVRIEVKHNCGAVIFYLSRLPKSGDAPSEQYKYLIDPNGYPYKASDPTQIYCRCGQLLDFPRIIQQTIFHI